MTKTSPGVCKLDYNFYSDRSDSQQQTNKKCTRNSFLQQGCETWFVKEITFIEKEYFCL